MDATVEFNKARWEELSAANVQYTRPMLNLDKNAAVSLVDPEGQLRTIVGLKVLCLAASGGQQSAAFSLLGAEVTVFDISERQLRKDRDTAEHYGCRVTTVQGDLQDLSGLGRAAFDIVWLAHSINFVPDARRVIGQIARVCKAGARIRVNFTNPFVHGVASHKMADGFLLTQAYEDGAEVSYADPYWHFTDPNGDPKVVLGPREFRHRLSTIINTVIENGLTIDGFWEEIGTEPNPTVGSWAHFCKVAPPWLTIWATSRFGG